MKSLTYGIIIVLILVVIGALFYLNSGKAEVAQNTNAEKSSQQNIVLSMRNHNYYPNTITVKAGEPVSISMDSSVGGCYRSFIIRDLGISKYFQSSSDTLNFTPTEKGTYRFSCSMGMGTGTLIVN